MKCVDVKAEMYNTLKRADSGPVVDRYWPETQPVAQTVDNPMGSKFGDLSENRWLLDQVMRTVRLNPWASYSAMQSQARTTRVCGMGADRDSGWSE